MLLAQQADESQHGFVGAIEAGVVCDEEDVHYRNTGNFICYTNIVIANLTTNHVRQLQNSLRDLIEQRRILL